MNSFRPDSSMRLPGSSPGPLSEPRASRSSGGTGNPGEPGDPGPPGKPGDPHDANENAESLRFGRLVMALGLAILLMALVLLALPSLLEGAPILYLIPYGIARS